MNWVDIVVLGVILVSGLLGAMRGLVREVLGVAAWVAAALIASPYGLFPYVSPWVRQQFSDPTVADAVAFGGVFLIVLIVLSLLVGALSNAVRGSALGGLDRTLGLVFGIGRGAVLLAVAYIGGGIGLAIEQWPAPVLEARSLPFIYQGAVKLAAQLPLTYRPIVVPPPAGRSTSAADLMRANPAGRASDRTPARTPERTLGTRPPRE